MKAGFLIFAALPILTTAQAVATDLRLDRPAIAQVAIATGSPERPVRAHLRSRPGSPEELSPLAYGAFALAEEGPEEDFPSGRSVRLYSVANGDTPGRAAASATASASKENDESRGRVKKAMLPEPGSWAMIIAGLLGVGAIARRRMSA